LENKSEVRNLRDGQPFTIASQWLVEVAHELNHDFEGRRLSVPAGVQVFRSGEELFRLGDSAPADVSLSR
jgi:hypothetical protein